MEIDINHWQSLNAKQQDKLTEKWMRQDKTDQTCKILSVRQLNIRRAKEFCYDDAILSELT